MRGAGIIFLLVGFWPFIWTIIEAVMLFRGDITSDARFELSSEVVGFYLRGWPAIIFGLGSSLLLWAIATVTFAFGHALYVLRDLMQRN